MQAFVATLFFAVVAGGGVMIGVVVGGWILLRITAFLVARLPEDA